MPKRRTDGVPATEKDSIALSRLKRIACHAKYCAVHKGRINIPEASMPENITDWRNCTDMPDGLVLLANHLHHITIGKRRGWIRVNTLGGPKVDPPKVAVGFDPPDHGHDTQSATAEARAIICRMFPELWSQT